MTDDASPRNSPQPATGVQRKWLGATWIGIPVHCFIVLFFLEQCSRAKPAHFFRFLAANPGYFCLNYLLILFFTWFCIAVTGRLLAGLGLALLPLMLIGVINRLKQDFLFDPFFPSDLRMIDDFWAVGINFVKGWQVLLVPLALSMPLAGWWFDRRMRHPTLGWRRRAAIGIACGLPLATLILSPGTPLAKITRELGIPARVELSRAAYREAGLLLGFTLNLKTDGQRLVPPEEYSRQSIEKLTGELMHDIQPRANAATAPSGDDMKRIARNLVGGSPSINAASIARPPHVIILHLESLFRIQDVPQFTLSRNPTPNIEKLWRDSGSIRTLTAKYGGGSIFSEFEATTAFSTSLFPDPFNLPYQLVLPKGRPVPTLAWLFRAHGYRSAAIAPYARRLFQVDKLYPLLGYEQHISREDFSPSDYDDAYIADRATVDRLLTLLKGADKPMFVFTATMGSHGPYVSSGKSMTDVTIMNPPNRSGDAQLDGYVRAIARLDLSIKTLFEGLGKLDRPVVVLGYGDHLPGIPELQKTLLPGENDPVASKKARMFTTVAFLWASDGKAASDLPDQSQRSVALLVPALLRRCGIRHPFYTEFLESVAQACPGIGVDLYIGPDGQASFKPPPGATERLETLRTIEYDIFFGSQFCAPSLFPEFTSMTTEPFK
ncbi:LTA synthase family protein [Humisphaera borealis]|uniref:LTA synthase family protein n=1 Tax=Humisphaera borealis TaxID=2807512 RepID=A0A7M2WUI2_9BACT|nr:LTA synthase family protein [Humisphaera borealis]QOV88461.1 LTA synthase family protein [Humisphaera borealis]